MAEEATHQTEEEKRKEWPKSNRDMWKTSPFDIPGPRCVYDITALQELLEEISKKYDVDEEEIFCGRSTVPPSDPACLVYLSLSQNSGCTEYFRKDLKPDGRWVCESYLHHIRGPEGQKGTYNYRYGIAYT